MQTFNFRSFSTTTAINSQHRLGINLQQCLVSNYFTRASVTVLLVALALCPPLAFSSALKAGELSPKLTVKALNSESFSIEASRGQIILVQFWATWCSACRKEMPILNQFYQNHRAENLKVIAISIDRERERKAIRKLMPNYSFPLAMMSDASENGFGSPEVLPTSYLIDANGVIQEVFTPGTKDLTEEKLTALLQRLNDSSKPLNNR